MAFELPKLPYSFDALEPHIDAKTMEIHYTKHHATYVAKLNEAVLNPKGTLEDVIRDGKENSAILNNGGGHYNHSLFWTLMSPNGGGAPTGELADELESTFGDFTSFKEEFKKVSLARFGSGWTWLVKEKSGMRIFSTPNQNPAFLETKGKILFCLDVWEHAYYLKFQNKRADYVDAFWNVVDWGVVSNRM